MAEGLEFTKQQIADWRKYEKVRRGGRYNMFDPRAQIPTGLSEDRYLFVMKHYEELEKWSCPKKD